MSSWSLCFYLTGTALALGAAQAAHAQATAPSSVTPATLRPDTQNRAVPIAIPDSGALEAPQGAAALTVRIDSVTIDGAFPEVADQTARIVAALRGRTVTLAEVYRAASEIEAAHARAGYVLARVVVPPQSLVEGGTLRLVVVDGFIEDVDVSGVPARVRAAVLARVAGLKGRHHVRLNATEQPLLIANEVPGLVLSSTLTRGNQPGGTRLVLVGTQNLLSGRLDFDNSLSSALGTYGFDAQLQLNSALGLGEEIYGFAASGYDLARFFRADVPVRVLGGGVVLPIGDGRLTINPEATFSRTQPKTPVGAPVSRGDLRRLTLRGGYTLVKTRRETLVTNAVVEQIDETDKLPDFGVAISHDRFMAARFGASYSFNAPYGSSFAAGGQVSQGLGGLGALRQGDLPFGTTYSRQGSSLTFTKLNVTLHGQTSLSNTLQLNVVVKGQTSFGKPVFRSEQAVLEGVDALSAYVGGVTAVDEALVARTELVGTLPLARTLLVQPYAFVAGGISRINRPTFFEPGGINAGSAGVGLRANLLGPGIALGVEYARGFADYAPLRSVDRLNVAASIRF